MRAAALLLSLSIGVGARGDIDRSQYRELPDAGGRTFATMTIVSYDRRISDEVHRRYAGQQLSGDYDVYVDANGVPTNVDVIRSIPDCDAFVAANLLAGHQTTKPSAAFVHHVTPHIFDTQAIERETPHLPDSVIDKHPGGGEIAVSYYVTLGTDGHITSVDPIAPSPEIDAAIAATLRRWRFKPQPVPLRTMLRFVFTIPAKRWR